MLTRIKLRNAEVAGNLLSILLALIDSNRVLRDFHSAVGGNNLDILREAAENLHARERVGGAGGGGEGAGAEAGDGGGAEGEHSYDVVGLVESCGGEMRFDGC